MRHFFHAHWKLIIALILVILLALLTTNAVPAWSGKLAAGSGPPVIDQPLARSTMALQKLTQSLRTLGTRMASEVSVGLCLHADGCAVAAPQWGHIRAFGSPLDAPRRVQALQTAYQALLERISSTLATATGYPGQHRMPPPRARAQHARRLPLLTDGNYLDDRYQQARDQLHALVARLQM